MRSCVCLLSSLLIHRTFLKHVRFFFKQQVVQTRPFVIFIIWWYTLFHPGTFLMYCNLHHLLFFSTSEKVFTTKMIIDYIIRYRHWQCIHTESTLVWHKLQTINNNLDSVCVFLSIFSENQCFFFSSVSTLYANSRYKQLNKQRKITVSEREKKRTELARKTLLSSITPFD